MEKLYEESWFYTVERDEQTNEYFLNVLCGTVGLFEVRVKLTEKEIKDFRRDEKALAPLARRILDSPRSFLNGKI